MKLWKGQCFDLPDLDARAPLENEHGDSRNYIVDFKVFRIEL